MKCISSLMAILFVASLSFAEDWQQWLGPRRDATTKEKVAPWQGGLTILWKQPVGEGHGGPIVSGGKVFLHTKDPKKDNELVSAYDAEKGTLLWQESIERGPFQGLFGNGPRATPSIAEGKLYTLGITGRLTAWDIRFHTQLWQVDTVKQFKAALPYFGVSASPLVDGDKIFVNVGGPGAGIVAFNKDDGKVIWQKLDDKASYASPIVMGEGDNRQAVFLTAQQLVGVAVKDGTVLWQFPLADKLFESSTTPVRVGDMLFAASVTYGGTALKVANGKADQVWFKQNLNCYFSTPVQIDDKYLYIVTGSGIVSAKKQAVLHCVEAATGKDLWEKTKTVGTYHASLTRTADNKLLLLEEAGDLVLVDPDPTAYKELARAHVCGHTWSHPAISDGRLFIRDDDELICVQLPK